MVVAAGAAVGAALLLRSAASAPATAVQVPGETVTERVVIPEADVLVAARALRVGEVTTPDDFRWASWPEASLNTAYLVKTTSPEALEDMAGRIVRAEIFESEPILPQRLVAREGSGIMAALVQPGMRAISFEISAESASGGFILPDDRVDVILTHEVEFQTAEAITTEVRSDIILENVRVLAIDQSLAVGEGAGTAIGSIATVELSPDDAALVALGEEKGTLSLALRSMADAAAAGDLVRSRRENFAAGRNTGQVKIFRNGRVEQSAAGGGE